MPCWARTPFTTYKSAATKPALRTITIAAAGATKAEVKRAVVVAEAVTLTRDLVNTPPNDLYPETFAKRAAELGRERGLTVEILDEKALRRGKFGGILAVGQGSVRPPRLVRLTYRRRVRPRPPRRTSRWSARASPSIPGG